MTKLSPALSATLALLFSLGLSACSDDSEPNSIDGGVDTIVSDSSTDASSGEANSPDLEEKPYPTPVSHWTFDDADIDGSTVKNAVTAGPAGTLVGATSSATGQIGQGLTFDGEGDVVDFGDVLDETFAGADKAFSVAFWIKPAALGSVQALLTKNGDSACEPEEAQRMFHSALMDDGILTFTYQTPAAGNPKLHKSSTPLSAGAWQHVVITYDGADDSAAEARVTLYLGAQKEVIVPAALGPFPFDLSDTTAHLGFGARLSSEGNACVADGAGYYAGALDELAIWDRVLSADEVTAVHARGLAGQSL